MPWKIASGLALGAGVAFFRAELENRCGIILGSGFSVIFLHRIRVPKALAAEGTQLFCAKCQALSAARAFV